MTERKIELHEDWSAWNMDEWSDMIADAVSLKVSDDGNSAYLEVDAVALNDQLKAVGNEMVKSFFEDCVVMIENDGLRIWVEGTTGEGVDSSVIVPFDKVWAPLDLERLDLLISKLQDIHAARSADPDADDTIEGM